MRDMSMVQDDNHAALLFVRALELHAAGDEERAKLAYIDVLRRDHAHHDALNNLGMLAFASGHRSAARRAFAHAVDHHPESLVSRMHFADVLYNDADLEGALEHYQAALRIDATSVEAHRGAANVFERLGDERAAAHHRDRARSTPRSATLPYRGQYPAIPAVLLLSTLGGNVNAEPLLDSHLFSTTKIFADECDATAPLPPHAFVFNGIGDAELCWRALWAAERLLAGTTAEIVNAPSAIRASTRAANAARLGRLPGVVAPLTVDFARERLAGGDALQLLAGQGFRWPLLLRSAGYHTGHHFVMVEQPSDLPRALESLPGKTIVAIEFLDARGPDGNARKYCVTLVDGRLYPLHLAISSDWNVNYFTPQRDLPEHRAEEKRFLADMRGTLGDGALQALYRIAGVLELDFGGIDFALDANGDVLLFEANATVVVTPRDEGCTYRDAARSHILEATRSMLVARAARIG